jgi:hypothetical protein
MKTETIRSPKRWFELDLHGQKSQKATIAAFSIGVPDGGQDSEALSVLYQHQNLSERRGLQFHRRTYPMEYGLQLEGAK